MGDNTLDNYNQNIDHYGGSNPLGITCKIRDQIRKAIGDPNKSKNKISKKKLKMEQYQGLQDLKTELKEKVHTKGVTIRKELSVLQHQAQQKLEQQISNLENQTDSTIKYYIGRVFGTSPDVIFLIEVILVLILVFLFIKALPKLNGLFNKTLPYSDAEFQEAQNLPMSSFTVGEMAKVNMEVKSLDDYIAYFSRNPCELESSGAMDLQRANAILPFIMFFIQYIMPPMVIGYIFWFIIKFWPFVIDAVYGFAVALYDYFSTKIQNKLGCRWYIRMITGWGCSNTSFDSYLEDWRRKYIDRPIYYQKLKYLQKMQQAKNEYYLQPYHQYITLPIERAKIDLEFIKKLYIDRALMHIRKTGSTIQALSNTKISGLNGLKQEVVSKVHHKADLIHKQVTGQEYPSVTKSGKACKCPGKNRNKSIGSDVFQGLANKLNKVKSESDMKDVVDDIDRLYQDAHRTVTTTYQQGITCQDVDNVISKRKIYARNLLVMTILSACLLLIYSVLKGKPQWLQRALTKTATYGIRGELKYQRMGSYIFIYPGVLIFILLLIMMT